MCLSITVPLRAANNQKIYSEANRYESILKLIYDYDLVAAERAADSLCIEASDNPVYPGHLALFLLFADFASPAT